MKKRMNQTPATVSSYEEDNRNIAILTKAIEKMVDTIETCCSEYCEYIDRNGSTLNIKLEDCPYEFEVRVSIDIKKNKLFKG